MSQPNTQHQPEVSFEDFYTAAKIGFRCTPTDRNPNMDSWDAGARHWRCTITRLGHRMSLVFSQGSAHTAPPSPADVLDCLALDASGYDNARGDFASWCGDYGYDTDSRKAERIYKAVARQAKRLERLLGVALYETLLWNTERL
jgi:hypothetical protein